MAPPSLGPTELLLILSIGILLFGDRLPRIPEQLPLQPRSLKEWRAFRRDLAAYRCRQPAGSAKKTQVSILVLAAILLLWPVVLLLTASPWRELLW